MKKTIVLLVYCINGYTQCTIKDISTNPDNPRNNELSGTNFPFFYLLEYSHPNC